MRKIIGATVGTTINPDKINRGSNVRNGEGTNSIEVGTGKALSSASIAGSSCVAGIKGYYIKAINYAERKILLDTDTTNLMTPPLRPKETTEAIIPTDSVNLPYSVGKYIGIRNENLYVFLTTIEAINGNVVTYAGSPYSIGFSNFAQYLERRDCIFFVPEQPDKGIVTFTEGGVALGFGAKAGSYAFSAGEQTIAHKYGSSVGRKTIAGYGASAEGLDTKAFELASHTEGVGTVARSRVQHIQGKYNVVDENNEFAHIVGNGTDDNNRSNAHTLDWEGNAWFAGRVYNSFADVYIPFDVIPTYYVNHGADGLVLVYENNDEFPGFTKGENICITLDGIKYICKINGVWDESDPGRFGVSGQYAIRVNIKDTTLIPDGSAIYTTYPIAGTKLARAYFYNIETKPSLDLFGGVITNNGVPMNDGDVVNKKYFDDAIAKLTAKIESLEKSL